MQKQNLLICKNYTRINYAKAYFTPKQIFFAKAWFMQKHKLWSINYAKALIAQKHKLHDYTLKSFIALGQYYFTVKRGLKMEIDVS
jgi:hypothetical protein